MIGTLVKGTPFLWSPSPHPMAARSRAVRPQFKGPEYACSEVLIWNLKV